MAATAAAVCSDIGVGGTLIWAAPDVKGWKRRHMGLLQDLVGRQRNGPFLPGFSFAVRLLLLVRVGAAMYANIQDCDEGECA